MSLAFLSRLAKYAAMASLLLVGLAHSTVAQEGVSATFDQTLGEKAVTLETVNPYDNTPGQLTITISGGTFHVEKISYGRKAGWAIITGEQQGSFKFVPYDSSQPTFSGNFKFGLSGDIPFDRHSDVLPLNFFVKTVGSDGSRRSFTLGEFATVNEYGADVSFGELKIPQLVGNGSAKP